MLVLTRKPQEKIRIGDGITITVIKTKGQGVRLGIEAPADVPVLRGELVAARDSFRKEQEAEAAASTNDSAPDTVKFARVSRSRVPSVLPDLLGDAGPLRAMLNARESSNA